MWSIYLEIENLDTGQVPNNYSVGCSLRSDVATQGILVGAHSICIDALRIEIMCLKDCLKDRLLSRGDIE